MEKRVKEILKENKAAVNRITTCIGATAIIAASVMGMTACDELLGSQLQGSSEPYTETDTNHDMLAESMVGSSEISTEAPALAKEFTYEECEKMFYDLFYQQYPEYQNQEYRLEKASVTYCHNDKKEWCNMAIIFCHDPYQPITVVAPGILLDEHFFTETMNNLPEEAIDSIAPDRGAFIVILDKLPIETKTELSNYIANVFISQYPELFETMEQ